jgi:thiamine-phosphate pyrophosphorylase
LRDFRLYIILDADVASVHGDIIEIARKIVAGGADILQLRAKHYSGAQILETGRAVRDLTRNTGTLFILNDHVDLSSLLGADGVHLGQDDLPLKDARTLLGSEKIIGISTHSAAEALRAEEEGADYIAVGPVFSTATKPGLTPVTTELITEIKEKVKTPFASVGGINLENIGQVLSSGAERVAVCRAVVAAKDVAGAIQKFRGKLGTYL